MKAIAKSFIFTAAIVATFAANSLRAVDIGQPAPDFTLTDTQGNPRHLSDFKGKIVVLEWVNSGCPIVGAHYRAKNMQATQKFAAENGAIWLQINTSARGAQGNMSGPQAEAWQKKMGVTATAYLQDNDGKVARLYHATNTPHLFIVNADGQLVYQGAIDDGSPGNIPGKTNYVTAALTALKAGQPVEKAATKAYGCGIHLPKAGT